MPKLKDLPDGIVFTVIGASEKGMWRKLGTADVGVVVESLSKPRMLQCVNPDLPVRAEAVNVG
jgi:hypothetical protein